VTYSENNNSQKKKNEEMRPPFFICFLFICIPSHPSFIISESIVTNFASVYQQSPKFSTHLASLEEQMTFVALQDDIPLLDWTTGRNSHHVVVEDETDTYPSW